MREFSNSTINNREREREREREGETSFSDGPAMHVLTKYPKQRPRPCSLPTPGDCSICVFGWKLTNIYIYIYIYIYIISFGLR
jgi:hypothetical protein